MGKLLRRRQIKPMGTERGSRKVGKAKNPSVVKLHLMGRPGVKGHVCNFFDIHFHSVTPHLSHRISLLFTL